MRSPLRTSVATLLLFGATFAAREAGAQVVATLNPVEDTLAHGDGDETVTHGSLSYLHLYPRDSQIGDTPREGAKTVSLIRFDLSSIPAGTVVNSATLRLFWEKEWDTQRGYSVHIFGALKPWTEADATYIKYDATNNWNEDYVNGIGNYDAVYTDRQINYSPYARIPPDPNPWYVAGPPPAGDDWEGEWVPFDVTTLAQDWIDESRDNYGLVVTTWFKVPWPDDTTTMNYVEMDTNVSSRESASPPELIVNYAMAPEFDASGFSAVIGGPTDFTASILQYTTIAPGQLGMGGTDEDTGDTLTLTVTQSGGTYGGSVEPLFTSPVSGSSPVSIQMTTAEGLDGTGTLVYDLTLSDGTTEITGTLTVTVTDNPDKPPADFTLTSPINGLTDVDVLGPLLWEESTYADSYVIAIALDAGFTLGKRTFTVTTNSLDVPAGVLDYVTTYYWEVIAHNTYGTKEASNNAQGYFETEVDDDPPYVTGTTPSGGDRDAELPDRIEIHFNEAVTVALPLDGAVTVTTGGAPLGGNVTFDDVGKRTLFFTPQAEFEHSTTYSVVVHASSIQDLLTNQMDQEPGQPGDQDCEFSFTTEDELFGVAKGKGCVPLCPGQAGAGTVIVMLALAAAAASRRRGTGS